MERATALYEGEPSVSGLEKELFDDISETEPWALVERFGDLERVSGTEDEREAAAYLEERLEAHDIAYTTYEPELWLSTPHGAELSATTPVAESFDSAKTVSFAGAGTVEAEVEFLEGPSINTMEEMLSASIEEIDRDVEGKIVLLETMSLGIETIQTVQEAGAAALLGIHPHEDEPHEGIATPVWGGIPDESERERLPEIPIVNVSRTDGDRLLELATAGEPLEVELTADVSRGWAACPLVVAQIPGEADPENDDFVLAHGHYDSWYVGITDNATGDAALLELARVFNEHRDQLDRDLWVAWWPGHSTGRYAGSTWFADEFAQELLERCVAQVNIDSPGAADATEFADMTMWMPEADSLCRAAIDDVAGKDTTENRPPRAGDYSFNNLGLSGLFMLSSNIPAEVRAERGYHPVGGSGGNSNAWHVSTDTIDKADPEVLVRDTRVHAVAIARLLTDDVVPLDHRRTVARHQEIVAGYDETAGEHFDLSPVRTELEALAEDVDALYASIDDGLLDAESANKAIKSLSRTLVHVNFASEGRFEQDPAVDRPPYPALEPVTALPDLEGDTYRFRRTHLKRAMNAVVADLRQAQDDLPVRP